jgi:hypothetical protein
MRVFAGGSPLVEFDCYSLYIWSLGSAARVKPGRCVENMSIHIENLFSVVFIHWEAH